MDRIQDNQAAMVETVAAYLNDNKAVWSGTKAFAAAVADLKAAIEAIGDQADRQQTPTKGTTDDKAKARDTLEEVMLEIADQLSALAEATGDLKLAGQVEFTRSALDKLTAKELETTAKRVAKLATANLKALADYNLDQDDLDGLDELTESFGGAKTAPRQAIAGRSAATSSLSQGIAKTRRILRSRIDKLVTPFRKTNPNFVAGYLAARVIVDRGGRNAKPPAATPPPAK